MPLPSDDAVDGVVDPAGVDGAAAPGGAPVSGPLTVAAVAARLGVAPATLRTWDRRYGLGPSDRTAGSHRRYSAPDVERLLVMRRLTLDGVAPGDAARLARDTPLEAAPSALPVSGGGVAATPAALLDAALRGDRAACARLLALAPAAGLAEIETWWTGLVEPTLAEIARRTVVDRPGQDAGLVVRAGAVDALAAWAAPERPTAGIVLVLVPPGQDRPLVAHVLAAALVAGGVDARVVGGPTGRRHALELVFMTKPDALVTVSTRADADLSLVEHVADAHPDLVHVVMTPEGTAWVPGGPAVQRSRSFRGMLHEVLAVVAAGANG
ncbi:MerR family transcriptional regulator [Cellulomonas sp.]|uniref:MerR family transcriptional regulator n=1 Tax=Cellulomonas sp. TaxID=40001 RepID=UPI00258ED4AE|nr:MerR family transcriptional regulator [Cellulomonas sp.]MCR6690741.1 MerR family transcriptional regulator [Cellulomonas sp.]